MIVSRERPLALLLAAASPPAIEDITLAARPMSLRAVCQGLFQRYLLSSRVKESYVYCLLHA